ncbi:hypothetical protein TD95_000341 [Thielaviopsis punctulata]|uniref:Protein-lysine N-methyltransferase EFM4 n=1 Tax=Thielaviopsis punctulata TaxID=72032 RepID=A0A0F4Z839_9PEZI|nr:hypothetical protein TD95_000341 [Thielaviopsis punctulata]
MTDAKETKPAHLEPSKLGTRDWDSLYIREQSNHQTNPADKGTVWFDDSDAEAKVLAFLKARTAGSPVACTSIPASTPASPAASSCDSDDDSATDAPAPSLTYSGSSFLDLGCGNGSLLFAVRRAGYAGRLVGIDYSAASIAFAEQIRATHAAATGVADAQLLFAQWDVLRGAYAALPGAAAAGAAPQFDVVLDKGTFDAISLCAETNTAGRRVCEEYARRVVRLVKKGGVLVITSCNWTEPELEAWFVGMQMEEGQEGRWAVDGRVKYRVFSFGGVTGQTISTVCFKRVE